MCGLVDEQRAELHAIEQPVAAAHECAGDDTCLTEELLIDAYLKGCGAVFESFQLLMEVLVAPLSVGA